MRSFDGDIGCKPRITLLTSGDGTTAEYLVRATQTGILAAEVSLVISSSDNVPVFDTVARLNDEHGLKIDTECIGKDTHPGGATDDPNEQTDEESAAILERAQNAASGKMMVIMMVGYFRKVRGPLMKECGSGWVNERVESSSLYKSHLGIVPATRDYHGRDVHRRVVDLRLSQSAQVLQGVAWGSNDGPIWARHSFRVPVAPEGASEEEKERITDEVERIAQKTEEKHLPKDLNNLLKARREFLRSLEY
jgi:folate-dependent phosphoribosylglycinamide formyltransferase PurN